MKKIFSVMVVVLLMSILLAGTANAEELPVGSCPNGYALEMFMEHTEPHMHHHLGLAQDLNADRFICMRIVSEDLHVHVDNSLPLR